MPAQRDHVLRLGVEQADRADVALQAVLAEIEDRLRRVGDRIELARGLVHAHVGGLRRQHHRDQQFERRGVVQFGGRLRDSSSRRRREHLDDVGALHERGSLFARLGAGQRGQHRVASRVAAFDGRLACGQLGVVRVRARAARRASRRWKCARASIGVRRRRSASRRHRYPARCSRPGRPARTVRSRCSRPRSPCASAWPRRRSHRPGKPGCTWCSRCSPLRRCAPACAASRCRAPDPAAHRLSEQRRQASRCPPRRPEGTG